MTISDEARTAAIWAICDAIESGSYSIPDLACDSLDAALPIIERDIIDQCCDLLTEMAGVGDQRSRYGQVANGTILGCVDAIRALRPEETP